jgi:SAM-dependent methyltransferase
MADPPKVRSHLAKAHSHQPKADSQHAVSSCMGRPCMSAPSDASRRIVCEACPLCDSTAWSAYAGDARSGFEWVRCACSCVFKRSEPAFRDGTGDGAAFHQDLERFVVAQGTASSAGDDHYGKAYFERYERRRRHRIAKSRRQIRDALDVASPGRLLDVGCSLGYTLEAAKSLGLDASGIDVSSHAVAECVRRGLDARVGGLDELPYEDASFSVAMLKHVFEHTPTPRRTLAELKRVLVCGGVAFFAVPNLDYFKSSRAPKTSRFFRGEGGQAHYVYYTPATLARMVESEGFRVSRVHPALMHRRGPAALRFLEALALPVRMPIAAIATATGLRKEFWLVAVRK